nr:hypothetical protein [uncultured Flavobacterium sp.]
MERILSYKKVDDYFSELATKHVDINDYCGASPLELAEKMSSVDGIVSPILVFFDYKGKLSGNQQRTFNTRSLAFSILYSGITADDIPGQMTAKTNAEEIGLEVLSRINVQSKMPDIGWLYNNFEKESVVFFEVSPEGVDSFYGMEFHFDLKTIEPLMVTKTKWTDGDIFCNG